MFLCSLYIFSGEVSVKVFDLFFKIRLLFIVFLFWVLKVLCIFLIAVLYQFIICKYFLPVCGLSSHLLISSCKTDIFKFNKVQLIIYACIMPLVLYLKSYHHHHHTKGHLGFLLCYLTEFLYFRVLQLGLWSILT